MKIAVIVVLGAVVAGVFVYCVLVLRNTFIIFRRPGGGALTFSRGGIWLEPPPDRYTENAFQHIETYVSRLFSPSRHLRFVSIFTTAGDRGFGLQAENGEIEALLTVEWRKEPQREGAIRAFFESLNVVPTQDYLAGNGGVPDATRVLAYPLVGSPGQVAALTERILRELCGVTQSEPLDISYRERGALTRLRFKDKVVET